MTRVSEHVGQQHVGLQHAGGPRDRARLGRESGAAASVWLVRIVAWSAFVATVWFAGPRALAVLEARFGAPAATGPAVDLDALEFRNVPEWLRGALLRACLEDLAPRLEGELVLMDESGARALRDRLAASAWLSDVRLERVFPDRFRVDCRLRRPTVQTVRDGRVTALVAPDGVAMPPGRVPVDLPVVDLDHRGGVVPPIRYGAVHPDPRAGVAARVARDWAEEVRAARPDAPRLVAVDADNLGYGYIADPRYSQVLVALERRDGGVAWLHHGLAADDGGPVDSALRAEVLGRLLDVAPGLDGVEFADLRRRNLWRDAVRPPLP